MRPNVLQKKKKRKKVSSCFCLWKCDSGGRCGWMGRTKPGSKNGGEDCHQGQEVPGCRWGKKGNPDGVDCAFRGGRMGESWKVLAALQNIGDRKSSACTLEGTGTAHRLLYCSSRHNIQILYLGPFCIQAIEQKRTHAHTVASQHRGHSDLLVWSSFRQLHTWIHEYKSYSRLRHFTSP